MSDIDELVAWIRAQLDDDEMHANGWCEDGDSACPMRSHPGHRSEDRVRREVEAKRRILDEYEKALDRRRLFRDDVASAGALLQMVAVVKLLALPYSDSPGYRAEWR